jgi:large subunit ribosomal protein L10
MKRLAKEEQLEQIKELIKSSSAMFLVDYRGVNVADINKLRSNFKKEGVTYKVFKNTLFKLALKETGSYEKFNDQLVGMIGVAFAGENFVAPAKIIEKYREESKKLAFRGCYLDSVFYGSDQLRQ